MRLSKERIKKLQALMKEHHSLELSDEEAQEAGMSIMRFVLAKHLRKQELNQTKEKNDDGNEHNKTT